VPQKIPHLVLLLGRSGHRLRRAGMDGRNIRSLPSDALGILPALAAGAGVDAQETRFSASLPHVLGVEHTLSLTGPQSAHVVQIATVQVVAAQGLLFLQLGGGFVKLTAPSAGSRAASGHVFLVRLALAESSSTVAVGVDVVARINGAFVGPNRRVVAAFPIAAVRIAFVIVVSVGIGRPALRFLLLSCSY